MTQDDETAGRNCAKLTTRIAYEVQLFIEEQEREGDKLITAETLLALAHVAACIISTHSAPAKELEWFIGCLREDPNLIGKIERKH